MVYSAQVSDSQTVGFSHTFFRTNANGFFRLDSTARRPVYVIDLGDQAGIVSIQSILREFTPGEDDADIAMLEAVAEALKYVTNIHIGDTFPTEMVNGEASWEPAARHCKIANKRVVAAMVQWSEGMDESVAEEINLRNFLAEQVDQKKIARALRRLEAALGGKGGRASEVQSILLGLTKELSYIEAQRELVGRVGRIGGLLEYIRRAGGSHAGDAHEISAVLRLFNIMMQKFCDELAVVDSRIADIFSAVSANETVCARIRQARDQLQGQLVACEDILMHWEGVSQHNIDLSNVASPIATLYRFLAPLYSPVDEWVRQDSFHTKNEQAEDEAADGDAGSGSRDTVEPMAIAGR